MFNLLGRLLLFFLRDILAVGVLLERLKLRDATAWRRSFTRGSRVVLEAAMLPLLGDGSPELIPESLLVFAALIINETEIITKSPIHFTVTINFIMSTQMHIQSIHDFLKT